MNVSELRMLGRKHLAALSDPNLGLDFVPEPTVALEVDVLLGAALGWERTRLMISGSDAVHAEQEELFLTYLSRRERLEPIAYILQEKEFYSRSFVVRKGVLVPRPETELVVETALRFLKSSPENACVIDIGTGSGVILLSLILEWKTLSGRVGGEVLEWIGVDCSAEALAVAVENAKRLNVFRECVFLESDLLSRVPERGGNGVELIVSNPPYIPTSEQLPRTVSEYEPALALFSGSSGLDAIEKILQSARNRASRNQVIIMEIGESQALQVESLALKFGFVTPVFHNDMAGVKRVVELRRHE